MTKQDKQYEKAGIIVSGVILILTIGLYFLFFNKDSVKSKDKEISTTVQQETQGLEIQVTTEPSKVEGRIEIDPNTLPLGTLKTEETYIKAKKIYLIDKELTYAIELLLDNVNVIYYVNQRSYEGINIEDKVVVEYTEYNVNNVTYYQINNVTILE